MRCKICQKEFIPSKYRPNQKVCSQPECQRLRQISNEREWRLRNPDYFKCLDQEASWKESRHRYSKLWRKTHAESLKNYEISHKEQRRQYMKEYMREQRKGEKESSVNSDKS